MSRARASRWWLVLLVVAACAVMAKALAYLAATPEMYGFAEQIPMYRKHRVWLLAHIACSVVALTVGTLQVILLRFCAPGMAHRWVGGAYAASVMAGGIAAMPLAVIAWGGIGNTASFGLLALLWMFSTLQGVRAIRRGAVASHRIWMIRSFALTLASVTLRAEVGLLQLMGLSFDAAYQIAPWTCWVLNLLAVEWFRASHPEPFSGAREAPATS